MTLSNQIIPGTSYKFRIRAANIHGFGEFSGTITIKAAGLADQVQTVVTSINPVTGGVTIAWIAPHDGSQDISSYLVEIQNAAANNFFEDETTCGGVDPSLTQCTIPMNTLT